VISIFIVKNPIRFLFFDQAAPRKLCYKMPEMTLRIILIVVLMSSILTGCFLESQHDRVSAPTDFNASELSYAFVSQYVLNPRCISCHGAMPSTPGRSNGGNFSMADYPIVLSGLKQIEQRALYERTMPNQAGGGALSDSEWSILRAWIDLGAPEVAAGPPGVPTQPVLVPLAPNFKSIFQNIFKPRCITCHWKGGDAYDVPLDSVAKMLASPKEIVFSGNAEESGLMIALERTDKKRMPPPPRPVLSGEEIRTIKEWINNGLAEE
jgi:uncharacterized membrane protein